MNLRIGLGGSTQNSHADTHDDIADASHIQSQGDITIAATNGDLNILGSDVHGDTVNLFASRDFDPLSQAD